MGARTYEPPEPIEDDDSPIVYDDGPADPAPPSDPSENSPSRMGVLEHLAELRMRLRNAFIAFFIALAVSFAFVERFFAVLTAPVRAGLTRAGFSSDL